MKGLYKGKYLIAIYDKDDYLLDVVTTPEDFRFGNKDTLRSELSRKLKNIDTNKKIHLIDCTEKHSDIFAEEDKIFLKYVKQTRKKTAEEKAKELGINVRTYYRREALKKKLNESQCHEIMVK